MTVPYRLIGAALSPYSVKLRAILRYRRLPFVWVVRDRPINEEIAHLRPRMIPVLQLPEDRSYHLDSTPLAYRLEERHPGVRSIVHSDPAMAFLSHLIEDLADEWINKMMFHLRWAYQDDLPFILNAAAREHTWTVPADRMRDVGDKFKARMGGKIDEVGSGAGNGQILHDGYLELLDLMETHLGSRLFLFGARPSLADFGLYGQLYTLSFDPTPMRMMRERAPRTYQWVSRMDDLSGLEEGAWGEPAPAVTALLRLSAQTHLPLLAACAEAVATGAQTVSIKVGSQRYTQAAFGYPAKCLNWLQTEYAALDAEARRRIDGLLSEAGALPFLSAR